MKKFVLFVLSLLLFWNAFSEDYRKSRVLVFVDSENLRDEEKSWLPNSVKDKLESNLRLYADFVIVNSSNEKTMRELQRKSESAAYDQDTAIEMGKQINAQYCAFTTVRRNGSKYQISVSFTDLTTGENIFPCLAEPRKNVDSLYSGADSAIDEVTLKLCDKFDIPLSSSQRFVLKNGERDLGVDEQIALNQKEADAFTELLSEYDKEIKLMTVSTDSDAGVQLSSLEAQRALYQEKLAAAQKESERLKEEAQKRAQDARDEQERSAASIKKRNELAEKASKKAAEVRSKRLEHESIINQLKIIESKKKALLEIRESISERAAEINSNANARYQEKRAEIENAPYRTVELDFAGNPTASAKLERANQIEQELVKINAETEKEIENLRNATATHDTNLKVEIKNNTDVLKTKHTASSLTDEIKISVGAYDGISGSWLAYAYFYSDGILLTQESFKIKYTDLTGLSIPSPKDKNYTTYADNVDSYTSLFNRGEPIITCELDYTVEPVANAVSTYKFNFSSLRVSNTIKNKLMFSQTPSIRSRNFETSPKYDISAPLMVIAERIPSDKELEEQRKAEEKAAAKTELKNQRLAEQQRLAEERAALEEQKAFEAEQKRIAKAEAKYKRLYPYDQQTGGGGAGGLRIGGGASLDGMPTIECDIRAAITPYVFYYWQLVGGLPTSEMTDKVTNWPMYLSSIMGFGINKRLFGYYPMNLYGLAGVGAAFFSPIGGYNSLDTYADIASYCVLRVAGGLDIPLGDSIALYGQYNYDYLLDLEPKRSLVFGIAFTSLRMYNEQ